MTLIIVLEPNKCYKQIELIIYIIIAIVLCNSKVKETFLELMGLISISILLEFKQSFKSYHLCDYLYHTLLVCNKIVSAWKSDYNVH